MKRSLVTSLLASVLLGFVSTTFAQMQNPFPLTVVPSDTGRGFRLTWTAPQGATVEYYLVYRAAVTSNTPPDSAAYVRLDTVRSQTFYRDFPPVLIAGGYVYRVLARAGGVWLTSNPVFVTFYSFTLYAYPADNRKVRLNWTAPPNVTVSYYLIYRAPISSSGAPPDSAQFTRIDSLSAGTEYRDTSAVPPAGGSYAYYLRAMTNMGSALKSNAAFVYIGPSTPAETFRLSAYRDSLGIGRLSWVAPTNVPVIQYVIYRAPMADPFVPIDPARFAAIDSTTLLQFVDSLKNIPSEVHGYAYVVQARTASVHPTSNVAVLAFVAPPSSEIIRLSASLTDLGRRRLNWTPPAGVTFSYYLIYRMAITELNTTINVANLARIDSVGPQQLTYIDSAVGTLASAYAYQVKGKSAAKTYESNIAGVLTNDRIQLSGYLDLDGSIELRWTQPLYSVARFYLLYRNPITDSLGSIDPTSWVFADTVRNTEYSDRPTASIANIRGFAYYVVADIGGTKTLKSNAVSVGWHPPVVVPFTLYGHVETDGRVSFAWNQPSQFTPTEYYLFRAILARNSTRIDTATVLYSLKDSTSSREIRDTLRTLLTQSNAFAYYVEARSGTNKTKTNAILVVINVTTSAQDRVYILSEPIRQSQVGALYTYTPRGISSDSTAILKWKLGDHPNGMTIDSTTGQIQWTPTTRGVFKVTILLSSNKGGKTSQEYYVTVAGARGFVEGVVTDTTGLPINLVLIKLFKRDTKNSFEYSTFTDSSGSYRFTSVDVGSYIAYAIPLRGNYIPQWYYDKKRPDSADVIVVADSATVTANFRLRSRAFSLPQYTLSGRVADTSNRAIQGAAVIFAKAEFILNSAKHQGALDQQSENYREFFRALANASVSFGLNGMVNEVFRAVTDTGGRYNLKLPQGAYIGISFAQGYRKVFYNGRTDLLSANVLKLKKDTTGINFVLIPLPNVVLGSISGAVSDSAKGTAVTSRMLAFRDKRDGLPADAYYVDTDTSGNYTINDLPPGDYYVLAVPLGNYVPSFYSLTGATLRWRRADKVTVNGNAVSGIDIFVKPVGTAASGYTYVQGGVTTTTGTGGAMGKRGAAVGVNGTTVFAFASDGSIAGYGIADETGSYTISGLTPGTYSVTTDKIGYNEPTASQTVSPSYDASGNPQPGPSANFTIDPTSTTRVEDGAAIPNKYALGQNYPNPFNPSTRITFNLPVTESISLTVYNILGQRVATIFDGELQAGAHAIDWNARSDKGVPLPSGVYFYQLKSDHYLATMKMILLK